MFRKAGEGKKNKYMPRCGVSVERKFIIITIINILEMD